MSIQPNEVRPVNGGRVVACDNRFMRCRVHFDAGADGQQGTLINDSGETVGQWQASFDGQSRKPSRPPTTPIPRPPQSRILPPGTWLSMLIQVATFGLVRPCTSCKSRARRMDKAGWRGLARLR